MMFAITSFRECLQQERTRLNEKWSDAARQGSIRARQGQAKYKTDLDKIHKDKLDAETRRVGYAKRDAAAGAAGAKKAETEKKQATATDYDSKIKSAADELKAMAAKEGRASTAYREKYAAYKKLQDDKRVALGGKPREEAPQAPEKEKIARAAKAQTVKAETVRPAPRKKIVRPANAHRVPTNRNRVRAVATYRRG